MSKMTAISGRILSQFSHDKRTLALLFVAPLIVLWLLSILLSTSSYIPTVAAVNLPSDYQAVLEEQDVIVKNINFDDAEALLETNDIDAILTLTKETSTLNVKLEGSDKTKRVTVMNAIAAASSDYGEVTREDMQNDLSEKMEDIKSLIDKVSALPIAGDMNSNDLDISIDDYMPVQNVETSYLHGSSDWEMFDFYGPIFIGLFIFVFTFLTSGMSLVNERSKGTMARFIATPVKSWQILGGYSLGFGALALVQSAVIIVIALKFIGFPNEGNVLLVVLVAVSLAIASVTLGLLVSGLATNAFQVVQLMLLFVVPQILLCGLFDLSNAPGWLQVVSNCLPLTYGVDAMREVMLRGSGFSIIAGDMSVVWGFIVLFFCLAAVGYRKKRARL